MSGVAPHIIAPEDRLLFGLTPFDDESFFGFTARLAAWNHFDSRRQLLMSAGFGDLGSQGLEAARGDEGRLAWHLRLSDDQLGHLSGRHDAAYGEYRKQVSAVARRVSPAGLRKEAYHRAGWALHQLPFCADSWEFLIEHCPACERRLGWASVLNVEFCEHCGFDLCAAETAQVPAEQQEMLSLLACLIDRDPAKRSPSNWSIPPQLAGCSPFEIFELAMTFARAVALEKTGVKMMMSAPVKKAAYMAAGIEIIVRYPESFDELMIRRNAALPEFFKLVRAYGGPVPRQVYERLFSDWEPCPHGPSRLRRRREDDGQLTLREAARAMGLENRDLRRLIDRGLIGAPDIRGNVRKCQWLDPDEVRNAAAWLGDRMSLQEFSYTFKIPIRGVLQLVGPGDLDRNRDPIVCELHGPLQLYRRGAEEFARRLLAHQRVPTPDVPVMPLEDVFHGIGGQEKPWGPILRAGLDRKITLYCDEEISEDLRISKLQISRSLAHQLMARQRPELVSVPPITAGPLAETSMTGVETGRYLNCFPRDVSWLLAEGHLSKALRPDEVAALGRTLISSREISWRWRVSPNLRETLAKTHGIRKVGPFWSRSSVEEHFTTRFPLGQPI